jgi:myosin heavy subunit
LIDPIHSRSDRSTNFGINHFAGAVFYDTCGFIEKNRDSFSGDLLALMPASRNKVL